MVGEGRTLDALSHVRAGRDRASAAERLELDVADDAVFADHDLKLHHCAGGSGMAEGGGRAEQSGVSAIGPAGPQAAARTIATGGGTDETAADVDVLLVERADLWNEPVGVVSSRVLVPGLPTRRTRHCLRLANTPVVSRVFVHTIPPHTERRGGADAAPNLAPSRTVLLTPNTAPVPVAAPNEHANSRFGVARSGR